jgi:hypothetical protein
VSTNEKHEGNRVVAVIFPRKLKSVYENHHKLSNLKEWIESFPPKEIFPCMWINCDKYKITVTNNVNGSVDETKESRMSTL